MLTQVEHDGRRGGPLDVRHGLRLGALELLLRGLGWCCAASVVGRSKVELGKLRTSEHLVYVCEGGSEGQFER